MSIIEQVKEYLNPELFSLAIALYIIGEFIKKTEKIDNKWIPIILGVVSIVCTGIFVFATTAVSGSQQVAAAIFTVIVQGVLTAAVAVYANQIWKQLGSSDTSSDSESSEG